MKSEIVIPPKPVVAYRENWWRFTGDGGFIPLELVNLRQWVTWRFEWRPAENKWTKRPFRAGNPRIPASHSDPESWDTFAKAVSAFNKRDRNGVDGIGYVFSADDPFVGADFDHCLGPDGRLLDWARPWLESLMPSYAEVSPSGSGIKVWIRGELPGKGCKRNGYGPDGKGAVEVYDRRRFFTVTGNPWGGEGTP
jgi:putative DNA primase/helicase